MEADFPKWFVIAHWNAVLGTGSEVVFALSGFQCSVYLESFSRREARLSFEVPGQDHPGP